MFKSNVKQKSTNTPKSLVVISSKEQHEGGEETEIAAQVTVIKDGGWGWVVVAGSCLNMAIMDGIAFTFGSILPDMALDLQESQSLVSLINSLAIAMYFMAGPFCSALINRFGFRACAMSGSVICSFSLFISYFNRSYSGLCVFYGFCAGFGFCLINMSSGLIVGFYFERRRAIALSISTCGSSVGVMGFSPLNTYLTKKIGWRNTNLLHTGLLALIYFISMTFRPVLSLTVLRTSETDDPTRTVTYLPTVSAGKHSKTSLEASPAEKLFRVVSNYHFPTAADVVKNISALSTEAGPSTGAVSKIKLVAHGGEGNISQRQLDQVKSMISRSGLHDKAKAIEISATVETKKPGCCGFLRWEKSEPTSRPMYRDDIFYDGKVQNLPQYKKHMTDTPGEQQNGLEYQMAVSRAAEATDLKEKRGIFTKAIRRVLATMMDPKLLKKKSFMLLCSAGFLNYLGYLVPYVFIKGRNETNGIDSKHGNLFVSVIGFTNAIGRISLGAIANKIHPVKVFAVSNTLAGLFTIASNASYNTYFQYFYCSAFGFFIAAIASLRSVSLVSLYGLDMLTNATGIMIVFQGFASLASTPLAAFLKDRISYETAFYASGSFITCSGLVLFPVICLANREKRAEESKIIKRNMSKIEVKLDYV